MPSMASAQCSMQLRYWVQVRTNGTVVSDSEVVTSNVLFLVKYAGPALASGLLVSTLGDDGNGRGSILG